MQCFIIIGFKFRPALLLFLFYFLNIKCIRVSVFLGNCLIRVSISFRYRYTGTRIHIRALGFFEGEHCRRLVCALASFFSTPFQVLDDLYLDLDLELWWWREKLDLFLHFNVFFVILLYLCVCDMERSSIYTYVHDAS